MPFLRLTLLTGICLLAASGWAQNRAADNSGQQQNAEPAKVDNSPLRRQLLSFSRRGDKELAVAISSMARTRRWADVDTLLQAVGERDTDVLASMAREIGPALLLRMKQNDQLGDSALDAIDRLEQATKQYAESGDRLRAAIDALDSPSVDKRLDAARVLLAGGNAAIAELVAAAVSESPTAPLDEILRVMLQLGPGGTDALQQLAIYGTPPVRQRSLQALARIDRKTFLTDLLTGMMAGDASQAEVDTATASLQSIGGKLPSLGSTITFFTDEFERAREAARLTDNNGQRATIWNVNEDRTGVTPQSTTTMIAAYRKAVDAAARLRRVGGLTTETLAAVLAADLAYRVMLDVDWGDQDQLAAISANYGDDLTPSLLSKAIGQSLKSGDHAANIGLIRLVASLEPADSADILLTGNAPSTTPLVDATSSADPRVRYEAGLAVSHLAAGRHQYPGSSRVMHCLSEMSSLSDQPSAILIETRPDVLIRLETLLRDIGFRVHVVGTVSDLQRLVARGGDLRLILSKTELDDLPAIEMIDLVRRLDRGRDVPIVFYGPDPGEIIRARRWKAPTVLIDRPISVAAFVGLFDAAAERRRLPALSIIDRQRYRDAADEILSPLAEAR